MKKLYIYVARYIYNCYKKKTIETRLEYFFYILHIYNILNI